MRWWLAAFLILICGIARAGELQERLPDDTLAFVELDPTGGNAVVGNGGGMLGLSLQAMETIGVLPKEAAVVGDSLGLASIAGERRNCVALLDADLAATPEGGLLCKSLQLAWLIDTEGKPGDAREIVEKLTRLLNHYSTRTTVRQQIRKTAEGQKEYVEFRDTRWPEWLTLAWTQRDNTFVLTLGQGAMEHYLSDRPVGGVPWAEIVKSADAQARNLQEEAADGKVIARAYVGAAAFREKYPEVVAKTVVGRVMKSVDLHETESAMVCARAKGRAISIDHSETVNGKMTVTPWTVTPDPMLLKAVPPEATAILAIKMDWPKLYERVTGICDATLKQPGEDPIEKQVADFAKRQGVHVQKDILAKLSPIVLVHDAPAHPLKLPLMVTAIGSASDGAQQAMDRLLELAETEMTATSPKKKSLMRFTLRKDKDGVRFMQFGLVGPAWVWSGNRWLLSWSPAAVRYNLPSVRPPQMDTNAARKGDIQKGSE